MPEADINLSFDNSIEVEHKTSPVEIRIIHKVGASVFYLAAMILIMVGSLIHAW